MWIAVCTVCWINKKEKLPELERFLDSFVDFYPLIIINGRWKDINGDYPRSIPEATDLILSYSNVILEDSPEKEEWENRNRYMEIAGEMGCDAVLVADTDEIFTGDKLELEKDIDFLHEKYPDKSCFKVTLNSKRSGGDHWPARIILNPKDSRYAGMHNKILSNGMDVFTNQGPIVKGIRLMEDRSCHNEEDDLEMLRRNRESPH